MSALLKIVQGPNAGAEIALPDGIEITVGKADSCDIVLADPTLPDSPMALSATPGGVLLDGAPLEPFHVVVRGSTAFAAGPADAAWGTLVWPKPEEPEAPEPAPAPGKEEEKPAAEPPAPTPAPAPSKPLLRRLLIPLAVLLVLLVLLVAFLSLCTRTRAPDPAAAAEAEKAAGAEHRQKLAAFAERYGLVCDESSPRPAFSGNFATRADRLAATAGLYSAFPGAALDLTDDESLKSAVSDALFALGGNALSVDSVTDRVAVLSGTADSPAALSAALDAIRADVPRLADVDTGAVKLRTPASLSPDALPGGETGAAARRRAARAANAANAQPSLPVCGILATPYPCLVLQNGSRVFPGATLGGFAVASIAPDSVVLTNANGSFTWKP